MQGSHQGGLNKKEIQLNICNIFCILRFLFICLMTLNCVELGCVVTFIKYLASVASLIFLPKTLIWNKIMFPASYSLNLVEMVENELKNIYQYSFFFPIYCCLMQRF